MTNKEAIKEIQRWLDGCPFEDTKESFTLAIKALEERPQGDIIKCQDCKHQIKEWIPIKLRPGTDEEYEAFSQYSDCPRKDFRVFECPLPDDNQEVLVTTRWGDVCIDIWHRDVDCCYFENNSDDDDVIAWMPLPEKYNSEVKND